jgi:hypothetical protein
MNYTVDANQTKTGLLIYLAQYSAVDLGPCLTENDTTMPYIMSKIWNYKTILGCYFCFIKVPGNTF